MAYEKLAGHIALASNSPGVSTGYGVQGQMLVERLIRHGLNTAVFSNYGLEGKREQVKTSHGSYAHYPKGFKQYSDDVIPTWWQDFVGINPAGSRALISLYDVWVYNDLKFNDEILAWTPLDHVSLPPKVLKFLLRSNVTPITMSPHGQRQLEEAGISSTYIPHAVDTSVFKPTEKIMGKSGREFLNVPEDAFLVTIVAANKANQILHRKALSEQMLAFSIFQKTHPDAYLYLHSEPSPIFGGFNLISLLKACDIDESCVRIINSDMNRVGYPAQALAGIYSASDVIMNATYGEGFGVPTVEAQACGSRVITSSWSASADLAGDESWVVEGQPFWDELQQAWLQIPLIGSLVGGLELAYAAPRGTCKSSIDFAKQFDVERVWSWYWLPLLRERFA
jgi:glycosyltransferase involved in cell wall biosynthesis